MHFVTSEAMDRAKTTRCSDAQIEPRLRLTVYTTLDESIGMTAQWLAAQIMLAASAGALLVAARGKLPDALTYALGPSMMFIGLYLGYMGSQRFFGLAPRIKGWLLVLTGWVLAMNWFTLVTPSFHARLWVFGSLMIVLFAVHAALLLKQRPATFATRLTGGTLAVSALIQMVRLALSITTLDDSNMLNATALNVVYVVAFVFMIVLMNVGILLLVTDRLQIELKHLATHDPLTNALTRRQLNTACAAELARCKRKQQSLALLMLDLDHFKTVNDTYGHQAGDRVLIRLVSVVQTVVREVDLVARYGGEEFIVLLSDTSLTQAHVVAERIRQDFAQSGVAPACTVSIGLTDRQHEDDTIDTLIARADAALYRAKTAGRNRVESG